MMKYRYYVSWFCKLRLNDNLGIRMDGHIEHGVFEINHPLTTQDEVNRFTQYLQNRPETLKLYQVELLAFSLMYIFDEKEGTA